ncbi:alkaline phosphatase family protein [Pseudonocardia eucalypti]|uniref:phospholipase C n=1 Tax=Pseudonocardia eucalypti TaxID=648755 RepID=A0ABP9PTT4_9PSEU|nr:phospholipase C [Pseudonocardia eucalypti]
MGVTRRQFLTASAAAAATAVLPPNLRRVALTSSAAPLPPPPAGRLADIRHVVLMMMENRSFDHYFGTLPGVRGFGDPNPGMLPAGDLTVFHQPCPTNNDGYLLPFRLNGNTTSAQENRSLNHSWAAQHGYFRDGAMDGFLSWERDRGLFSYLVDMVQDLFGDRLTRREMAMGYFTREDIPFHHALAESFTICDNYFSSVLGPTWPNRLMWMTGTIDPEGRSGGPVKESDDRGARDGRLSWTTYAERLERAGVSWRVYDEEPDSWFNPLRFFRQFRTAPPDSPLAVRGLAKAAPDEFERDVAGGRLPTVSWICPSYADSEHPDRHPADGAAAIARKLEALAAHPDVWNHTVFILNYDENDGLFDHVRPTVPAPGTPGEFVGHQHIGPGFRVPCLVISPWSAGGWVSGEPLDHTSVLRFLERVTGVMEPNISQWRRQTFGDLVSTLRLSDPPAPGLPPLPDAAALARQTDQVLLDNSLPAPEPPSVQTMPTQQAAARPHTPGPARGR